MAQSLDVRERTEELERASLSSWATLALETKGRDRYEEPDPLRTVFQADRERIATCAAWGTLAGKSTTLPADGSRTGQTRSTAVAQVARALARALRLNEDLAEAVALGEALGMAPFSDAGAEGLELALERPYRPAEQALRVVERLEGDGRGLNLTWETRDGILHQAWEGTRPATLEGEVARFARRIVEVSALLGEALDTGALDASDPPRGVVAVLGARDDERLNRLTGDVARTSVDRPELAMSAPMAEAQAVAHEIATAAVTGHPERGAAHARAVHCVASVAIYHLTRGEIGGELLPGGDASAITDRMAWRTERDLLADYRAMYEPHAHRR